eukprot:TRINITY_DN2730_c0_g1_i1.p1 TRINITY_DN2730_c0_g1~~TRINITY_DN2730_c0_g1_i1.p1  ORF type:complete len:203 (-),score=31.64 TRINITY_DN2730_c0_g1_i1:53-634(-)
MNDCQSTEYLLRTVELLRSENDSLRLRVRNFEAELQHAHQDNNARVNQQIQELLKEVDQYRQELRNAGSSEKAERQRLRDANQQLQQDDSPLLPLTFLENKPKSTEGSFTDESCSVLSEECERMISIDPDDNSSLRAAVDVLQRQNGLLRTTNAKQEVSLKRMAKLVEALQLAVVQLRQAVKDKNRTSAPFSF